MNIPLTFRLLFSPRLGGIFSEQQPLKLGDNLTGKVLEVKGNGLVLFEFNRMKAWAEVKFPVKKGDVLHVTVVEKGAQLKLKLLHSDLKIPSNRSRMLSVTEFPPEKVLAKLRSEINKITNSEGRMLEKTSIPRHIEGSIKRIASHFKFLNMGKSVPELSLQLKSYVENSGIFFEKRIENAMGKLFQLDKEIFSKNPQPFPEIKEIIKRDLKPNLLILKAFFDGKEMESLKKDTTGLREIKPLIYGLIKDMDSQQNKAITAKLNHGPAREVVYRNPSKSLHAGEINPREILHSISKLLPRLHAFFQLSGTNDERIQHAMAKLSDAAGMISPKDAAIISDAKKTTARNTVQSQIGPHLKLLKDFYENKEQSFKSSGAKEIQNIKLPLDRIPAKLSNAAEMVPTKDAATTSDAKETTARNTVQSQIGPHLKLLKDFFDNKEQSFKSSGAKEIENIKLPLDRILAKLEILQNHTERVSPKEILLSTSKLVPRLHAFFQQSGANIDEKIQHAMVKLSETAEMVPTKDAAITPDAKETTVRDTVQNQIGPHLKLLKEFFDNKEQSLRAFGAKELETIKLSLDRLLMETDTHQYKGKNTQQGQKSEPWQTIAYSLPLGEEDQSGKLKIYYSKRTKGASKKGFRMSLLLQMTRIGDIRADLSLMDRDLRITLFVNDHTIKTYIDDHSDDIKNRLADRFNHLMLEVVLSEKKIEEFETEQIISENAGVLNVIV